MSDLEVGVRSGIGVSLGSWWLLHATVEETLVCWTSCCSVELLTSGSCWF